MFPGHSLLKSKRVKYEEMLHEINHSRATVWNEIRVENPKRILHQEPGLGKRYFLILAAREDVSLLHDRFP